MQTNSKAKIKRRRKGKIWVSGYSGNCIVHAYKRHFKIPLITAVNDLEEIGIQLDENEVARIKIERHYNNQQHLSRSQLAELAVIVKQESDS